MPDYGFLHLGTVIRRDTASGGYFLDSVGLARTLKWGPVPSCVPGLSKGDKVILGSKGTSRDDLVVLAKINNQFPGVGDIEGLLDALADKARAVDVDLIATQLAGVADDATALTARVTAVEGRATTLEGRATALEGRATALEGRATTLEGQMATANSDIVAIQVIEAARPYNRGDQDLYGHLIESVPRHAASSSVTLANGVANLQLSYSNRAFSFATLRAVVTTAGTGAGSAVAAVYVGTSRANLILHVTQTISLAALGEQLAAFSGGGQAFNGFPYMALGILGSGYTAAPQVAATPAAAHSQVVNPSGGLSSATKSIGAWPGTVDLTDGTWASASGRAWFGLSP